MERNCKPDGAGPVYLDWAATAPLSAAAAAALAEAAAALASGRFANPSSQHGPGRAARRALQAARATLADVFATAPDEIIFTSGGTEALALAIGGTAAPTLAAGATEHAAVHAAIHGAAPDAVIIPVDSDGRIEAGVLDRLLAAAPAGALVAIQQANNETGVIQDVAALADLVHHHGGRLLVDAVQSAGTMPLPPEADLVAVSAHKLGGPMGVGMLIARRRARPQPVQRGGGQEGGTRGGTENLPGILGFAAAMAARDAGFPAQARALQQRLEAGAVALGARVNAVGAPRLPTISSLHLPGVAAATQLMALDLAGIAASSGPACSSGTLGPSPTLAAMGQAAAARESLRVSTGPGTTAADIDRFLAAYAPLAARRAAA